MNSVSFGELYRVLSVPEGRPGDRSDPDCGRQVLPVPGRAAPHLMQYSCERSFTVPQTLQVQPLKAPLSVFADCPLRTIS